VSSQDSGPGRLRGVTRGALAVVPGTTPLASMAILGFSAGSHPGSSAGLECPAHEAPCRTVIPETTKGPCCPVAKLAIPAGLAPKQQGLFASRGLRQVGLRALDV
jgi:hypothetical protein